ncbi:MAG TPA: ribonuclease P protein subunit [Candidatus Nanoarchaeia archaeon]|nr:ribonuclease P protein subunit [Candidatus Nanoarchaeia archaeon]
MYDIKDNLIGKKIEVINSNNKDLIGIKGIVLDERRDTIKIEEKMVLKKQVVLLIDNTIVNGCRLVGRPEERIKW